MKKRLYYNLFVLLLVLVFAGCQNGITADNDETEDGTTKTLSTWDASMDQSTISNLFSPDSRNSDSEETGMPADMKTALLGVFDEMTEEEQAKILASDNLEIEISEEIDNDSGNLSDEDIEELSARSELKSFINSAFLGKTVSNKTIYVAGNEMAIEEPLFAGYIASLYVSDENWDSLSALAEELEVTLNINEVKNLKASVDNYSETSTSKGLSSASHYDTVMTDDLGSQLKNGDILIVKLCNPSTMSAISHYIIGDYHHGGIFDYNYWSRNGREDDEYSVLTAQSDQDGMVEEVKAENPGHVTRDPLTYYTRSKAVKILRPKSYTEDAAKTAIAYAKAAIDVDEPADYDLPYLEAVYIGNTSHDLNISNNPYCTKVVYSAWKKAGINVDGDTSNTNRGYLVAPDDIISSASDRYYKFKILWKTYKYKTYSATTNIVESLSR
ncbi:MAG: hypothetical protein PQJ46_08040 [Spirochaetales bacterium]|nr:hypothetical protein [Spirochaetales bacterium]